MSGLRRGSATGLGRGFGLGARTAGAEARWRSLERAGVDFNGLLRPGDFDLLGFLLGRGGLGPFHPQGGWGSTFCLSHPHGGGRGSFWGSNPQGARGGKKSGYYGPQ